MYKFNAEIDEFILLQQATQQMLFIHLLLSKIDGMVQKSHSVNVN